MTEDLAAQVHDVARRARAAAADLATLPRADKDAALMAMADALEERASEVLAGNAEDVVRAEKERAFRETNAELLRRVKPLGG